MFYPGFGKFIYIAARLGAREGADRFHLLGGKHQVKKAVLLQAIMAEARVANRNGKHGWLDGSAHKPLESDQVIAPIRFLSDRQDYFGGQMHFGVGSAEFSDFHLSISPISDMDKLVKYPLGTSDSILDR